MGMSVKVRSLTSKFILQIGDLDETVNKKNVEAIHKATSTEVEEIYVGIISLLMQVQ